MKKENGKVLVEEYRRVIPKDREKALAFYLNELREFNHGEAADFIEFYIARERLVNRGVRNLDILDDPKAVAKF